MTGLLFVSRLNLSNCDCVTLASVAALTVDEINVELIRIANIAVFNIKTKIMGRSSILPISHKEQFLINAKKTWGSRFDYSKMYYINATSKILITCRRHGDFWQQPIHHLKNRGCPFCNAK